MRELAAYLRTVGVRPFRYGRHDCTTVAAEWVRQRTGRDLLAGWAYGSLREGRALLAERGFASQGDVAATVLAVLPPLGAHVGDLAEVNGALGIVTGAQIALLRRPRGIEYRPLATAQRAFRVA